ncbi:MAG: hypothetical protein R2711_03985 [Acidimicrobiales bacterium]
MLEEVGTDLHLSLDVKDPAAGPEAVRAAMAADPTLPARLWMCDQDHDRLLALRAVSPHVRLVDSTRLSRIREGIERRAARLQELGIDALNLHHSDWSGGHTTLVHRFGRIAFGWDAVRADPRRSAADGDRRRLQRPRRSDGRRAGPPRRAGRDGLLLLRRPMRQAPTSQVGRLWSSAPRSPGPAFAWAAASWRSVSVP